jgi:hypothetical protein
MAAAIIPIAIEAGSEIVKLIASLVHKSAPAAEQNYGPSAGPVKFADVFAYVMEALQKAAGAGKIDKALPSDSAVKLIIEAVIQSMKLQGALSILAAPSVISSGDIVLRPGQSLTIRSQS